MEGENSDLSTGKRQEWIRFAESLSGLAPFDRPIVWLSWLEAHPERTPAIFERRDGEGNLIALLPLYRMGGELRAAGDEHLDYQGILASNLEDAAELLRGVIGYCLKHRLVLTLRKVSEDSLLYRALQHPRVRRVAWIRSRFWAVCPVGNYSRKPEDDCVSCLPRNRRRDYRKADRRLREIMPELTASHLEGGKIDSSTIDEIAEMHVVSEYGKKGQSRFTEEGFRDFLSRLGGQDSSFLLSLARDRPGGKLVAFIAGFSHPDAYYFYVTSYRDELGKFSPGNWILVEALKQHVERHHPEGLRLDLLSGSETYKKRWAGEAYQVDRFRVFPRRWSFFPRFVAFAAIYQLKAWKNRWLGVTTAATWEPLGSPTSRDQK